MDPDAVAKAFVDHYYSTFDSNRAALVGLYQDSSMLTFEAENLMGSQAIVAKLAGLPFQQFLHQISTTDCQPSGPAGGMLVFFPPCCSVAIVPLCAPKEVSCILTSDGKFIRVDQSVSVEDF